MKVTLIPGQELSDDLVGAWIELQQLNPDLASPYFHPEFTKVIAAVRQDVEVAVLESEGKIVGFFPFQREQGSFARPIGGIISDYHGLICSQKFRFSPRELLRETRLTAWDFDHLPTSQSSFARFQWSVVPSPQIDVSQGYDAYVQQRRAVGSEQIKKIGNLVRAVEREHGPLRFVADSTDTAALAAVLTWKSMQYRQTGKPDLFSAEWIRDALGLVFRTHIDGCSGLLSLLYAGDRLVAGHLGMRSRQRWHYWFPSYDSQLGKYSPGLMLLLKMAAYAPSIGVPIIDLGAGMSPYKQRLMNSCTPLASGKLESSWRSLRRKAWRMVRLRLGNSSIGPPARATLEWLQRRGGADQAKTPNSDGESRGWPAGR